MSFRPSIRLASVFLALFFTLAPAVGRAAMVINELLPDPVGVDDNNETVEIYNTGPDPVDVTGWAIEDAATINDGTVRRRIPEDFDPTYGTSAVIAPGTFRLVKGTGVAYLNQTGDTVYLCSNRTGNLAAVIHTVNYPSASGQTGKCWANEPDGAQPTNFTWRTCTPGVSNCGADLQRPAPTNDLAATAGSYAGEVHLAWTAVGNDSLIGTASLFTVKYNTVPITPANFAASTDAPNAPIPGPPGTAQSMTVFGLSTGITYYFAVETLDCHNTSALSNVPSTLPGTTPLGFADRTVGLNHYYGNLHSHTSYSDGVNTPPDAYNFARNLAPTPLDFLAVTDHNHASAGPMSPTLYQQGLAAAAAATQTGSFVGIYGQEWGLAANGHVNVWEAPVLFGWDAGRYDVFTAEGDYASLYTAIKNNPSPWGPLAEFCHPNAGDFSSQAYTADGGLVIRGITLVNGPATSTSTTESDVGNTNFDAQLLTAIKNGYFMGMIADQDNHFATWGASSQSRTVVLTTELSKDSVMTALKQRHMYASQDHNVRVAMKVQGWPMGSNIVVQQGTGVNFDVNVTDPDGEHVSQFELYRGIRGSTTPQVIASASNLDHFVYRDEENPAPADGAKRIYYVRITQVDNHRIWTAPVEVTFSTATDVVQGPPGAGTYAMLYPARPNPFNPTTELRFELGGSAAQPVRLGLYDVSGRLVRTLVDARLEPGSHRAVWDGRDSQGRGAASGVYLARLVTPGAVQSRNLVLLR